MKVLYLAHYKEGTGWSRAAIDYIMALDSVGVDVVCRNIKLTNRIGEVPDRVLELEKKSFDGCTVCIQHILPHHLVGTRHFDKNIAYFVSESTSIKTTPWFPQLQQMDEVWVPNSDLQNGLTKDKLFDDSNRIRLVPHTFDLDQYVKSYRQIFIESIDHKFKFYFIGEFNDRKNLGAIIRSFHSEFDRSEPVALILKVKRYGFSPKQLTSKVEQLCTEIKKKMRMYPSVADYHREVIISDEMDNDGINSLHQYGDCFVCASHGEGWSIPAFDAMCFENTPICSAVGGPKDFIGSPETGRCVNGVYSVCDSVDSAFPEMFTGREEWFVPCEYEMKSFMRYYYTNRDQLTIQREHSRVDRTAGLTQADKFSYENVGNKIKEYLGV